MLRTSDKTRRPPEGNDPQRSWWVRMPGQALDQVRTFADDLRLQRLKRLWLEVCWDMQTGLPRQGIFLSRLDDLMGQGSLDGVLPAQAMMALRLPPPLEAGQRATRAALIAMTQELRTFDPGVVQWLSRLDTHELVWTVGPMVPLQRFAADLTARLLRVASQLDPRPRLMVAAVPLSFACRAHERLQALRAALDRSMERVGEPLVLDVAPPASGRPYGARRGLRIARAWGAIERPVVDAEGFVAYFECESPVRRLAQAPRWPQAQAHPQAPSDLGDLALALRGVRADGRERLVRLDLGQWQRRSQVDTLRHWLAAQGRDCAALRMAVDAADAQRHPASLRAIADVLREVGTPLGLARLGYSPGQFELVRAFRPAFVEFDRMLASGLRQATSAHVNLLRECVHQVRRQGVRCVVFQLQSSTDAAALCRLRLGAWLAL